MTKRRQRKAKKGMSLATLSNWGAEFNAHGALVLRRTNLEKAKQALDAQLEMIEKELREVYDTIPKVRTRAEQYERELKATVHPLGGIFILGTMVIKVTRDEVGLVGTLTRAVPQEQEAGGNDATGETDTGARRIS